MADFAVQEDVENVLLYSITEADEIAAVGYALEVSTDAIRVYVEQYIERVVDDAIVVNGPINSTTINLPEIPVISVSSIYEDDVLLVADEDYKLDTDLGVLHRIGQVWSCGIQNIAIVYTHGYDPIPDTVNGICARMASRIFQAGLRSKENDGIPGVASKSLGDFAVSFEGAGSASDGVMGVSAARVLLLSEKDLLDKYKAS